VPVWMIRDVQVLDEQQEMGSGVGSADADVVEASGVAEGDSAGGADDIGADAPARAGRCSLTIRWAAATG
jgi:hypothetical protein